MRVRWVPLFTQQVTKEKVMDPTTPTMEVIKAYRMPGIKVWMPSITFSELDRSILLMPMDIPIKVPKKPNDTMSPGKAPAISEWPGSIITVSSLM